MKIQRESLPEAPRTTFVRSLIRYAPFSPERFELVTALLALEQSVTRVARGQGEAIRWMALRRQFPHAYRAILLELAPGSVATWDAENLAEITRDAQGRLVGEPPDRIDPVVERYDPEAEIRSWWKEQGGDE